MAFSFSYDFTIERNRIRHEIGDTIADEAAYQDEDLDGMKAAAGTWQATVIMALEGEAAKWRKLVGFTADWLKVDPASKLKATLALIAQKKDEYGLSGSGSLVSGGAHVYRADSLATEEPYVQD